LDVPRPLSLGITGIGMFDIEISETSLLSVSRSAGR
jgi:hypothetical protein